MELCSKIVNGIKLLAIFVISSIADVWLGSECASTVKYKGRQEVSSENTLLIFIFTVFKEQHMVWDGSGLPTFVTQKR